MDVVQKAVGVASGAAHCQREDQRRNKYSDGVVPVEKLEAVPFHAFIGIGPGSPADRGGEHHHQREAKTLRCEHVAPCVDCWFDAVLEYSSARPEQCPGAKTHPGNDCFFAELKFSSPC